MDRQNVKRKSAAMDAKTESTCSRVMVVISRMIRKVGTNTTQKYTVVEKYQKSCARPAERGPHSDISTE